MTAIITTSRVVINGSAIQDDGLPLLSLWSEIYKWMIILRESILTRFPFLRASGRTVLVCNKEPTVTEVAKILAIFELKYIYYGLKWQQSHPRLHIDGIAVS